MTLILKLDSDMVKMYLYAENEVLSYCSSKVIASTDRHRNRHTDRQADMSEIITYPHQIFEFFYNSLFSGKSWQNPLDVYAGRMLPGFARK